MVIFETDRLRARALTPADANACFELYGDPEVTRYVTPGGISAPSVDWVRGQLESGMLAPQADPRFGFWALEMRADAQLIGTVALIELDDTPGEYEMGWHLMPAHWGVGYAQESGSALLDYGLFTLGLHRVHAFVMPGNDRSLRACERLGLKRMGTRMQDGVDHVWFSTEPPT